MNQTKHLHIPSTIEALPVDWSWSRLDDACEGVYDCPHSTPTLTENGPLVVRSQDIRSGVLRTDEAGHVSEETYSERVVKAEPRHGDLLYSREGTYFGIAAEVPPGVRACLGQRMVLIRPNSQVMNETLEAMARTLFRSWFVDFDPVRAKIEGRKPQGMDADTAALFPDAFEDSALGLIPKGWLVESLSNIAEMSRDGLDPGDFPSEVFDHYSIPAFDEGKTPKREAGEEIKSNKFLVRPEAVLLSKLNPRIPRVWLPHKLGPHRSVCSTEFIVCLAKKPCTREYLYALTSSEEFMEACSALVTGTSGSHQRVKPGDLFRLDVICPKPELVACFTRLVRSLFSQVGENIQQSLTLSTLRGALLPELLSGELRVKDSEKLTEAAM
jgi:type I restriction enzyme S subunit